MLYRNKSWLSNQYVKERKSTVQISRECLVSESTIYKWLVKYGIPRRSRSEALRGLKRSEKARKNLSESKRGKKNPMFGIKQTEEHIEKRVSQYRGKSCSEETKRKISEANSGKNNGQWKGGSEEKVCVVCEKTYLCGGTTGRTKDSKFCSMDCRDVGYAGEYNPAWSGGISFEPYCPKFNDELREEVRNRDNRVCRMPDCGKSEIENGARLSVHHIDGDKAQGCGGKTWYLAALCRSCNSKPDTLEKEFLIVANS